MTEITAETKLYGLVGWPVGHSASPAMQNAAFAAARLDAVYVPLAVEERRLPQLVEALKTLGFGGVNVTVPHKVAVAATVDELDDTARRVGAVNTLVLRQGRCQGYNTDAPGFVAALARKGIAAAGRRAVLLGAGGAARAVAVGLADAGAASISVAARRPEQADWLAVATGERAGAVMALHEDAPLRELIGQCDLLVQCTSLGMQGKSEGLMPTLPWDSLPPGAVCCDIVYRPLATAFLQEARRRGHPVVSGEGMLAEQGALAFELWTEQAAPRDLFYRVLADFLGNAD